MALQSTQPLTEMSTRNIFSGKGGRYLVLTTFMCRLCWNLEAPTSWNPLELYCCIVMRACNVLLFYRNPFVDLYCHMFIATLASFTHVTGVVLRILYTPACREIRAVWGTNLNPYGDQRSWTRQLIVIPLYCETSRCITQTLDQAVSGARHPKIIWWVWRQ